MNLFFSLIIFTWCSLANSSAIVKKDEVTNTLTFSSHIYLYGSVDINIAKQIENEINSVWNKTVYQAKIAGRNYKLQFKITTSVTNEQKILSLLNRELSPKNNFIRVLKSPTTAVTTSFILGHTNSGVWLMSQNLGKSTTAAHEYGHTLGLKHPEGDKYLGAPRLMITDFYKVDSQYAKNGKLDLTKRSLQQIDINELQLDRMKFDSTGTSSLGKFDNVFLFDETGNIIN